MVSKVTILVVALSAISTALATIDKRIVGGDRAELGEFPFMVFLDGPGGICGGTLLNSDTVLTAAHCDSKTIAKAGVVDRKNGGGVEVKVASFKPHPDYYLDPLKYGIPDFGYAINDIGIIKLATPIKESETISYAKLPADGLDPVPDSTAIAIGWGINRPVQSLFFEKNNELLKVNLTVHTREDCSKLNAGAAGRDTIVCAGGNGKNTCGGDSGGPLIDPETKQVVGITSWGILDQDQWVDCNKSPAVYTRVGSYVRWINENSGTADADATTPPNEGLTNQTAPEYRLYK